MEVYEAGTATDKARAFTFHLKTGEVVCITGHLSWRDAWVIAGTKNDAVVIAHDSIVYYSAKWLTDTEEAVAVLDALTDENKEQAHINADNVLLKALKDLGQDKVATAYVAAAYRVGFFYI